MNIVDSADWYVERGIGAEVGRGDGGWVDSNVGVEVGRVDGDGVELEVGFRFCYRDNSSVNKYVRGAK